MLNWGLLCWGLAVGASLRSQNPANQRVDEVKVVQSKTGTTQRETGTIVLNTGMVGTGWRGTAAPQRGMLAHEIGMMRSVVGVAGNEVGSVGREVESVGGEAGSVGGEAGSVGRSVKEGSVSSSSSTTTTASPTVRLTVALRGDEGVERLDDVWGDYQWHDAVQEHWPWKIPALSVVRPGSNVREGHVPSPRPLSVWQPEDYTASYEWVGEALANRTWPTFAPFVSYGPNEEGEYGHWSWKSANPIQPEADGHVERVDSNAGWQVDSDGIVLPEEYVFQHRKFNRTESTFVIKYYELSVKSDECGRYLRESCDGWGVRSDNGYGFILDNDPAVEHCLGAVPATCVVSVSGYWNFTAPHAPDLCCSNVFGVRLPSPGHLVPRQECVYGNITVHNFAPLGSLRDQYALTGGTNTSDFWNGQGKRPLAPWNVMDCLNNAAEPYERGCQARIEFGKNIPDQICSPADFYHSILISNPEDYQFTLSELSRTYHWQAWDHQSGNRTMMDAVRMDFKINIPALRDRQGDKSLDGFMFNYASSVRDWCGSFGGVEVPFSCSTHGFKNYYLPEGA
ncbi:hypothetical protein GNI_107480 [Gregarina niphandrodes]|uniref:Transmembrane protein n=1 Tax=Gregarina niphandrodes TaxID=110365 RepID=A0A023B3S8_GRENI|nr:hypothetical protein GNI_107480 [Gregarina niphandrodes]EZG55915.1 hypothetical protein GNI_107480 [Gregarina niphandrodes]|eukprot:XP_011131422.1 hypothetical protein GNI_107480 [Gregarina niphandrodes]